MSTRTSTHGLLKPYSDLWLTDLHEDLDSQVLNSQIFSTGIPIKSCELPALVRCLNEPLNFVSGTLSRTLIFMSGPLIFMTRVLIFVDGTFIFTSEPLICRYRTFLMVSQR